MKNFINQSVAGLRLFFKSQPGFGLKGKFLKKANTYFYLVAGLALVWGQILILTAKTKAGIIFTLFGGISLLLTMLGQQRLTRMVQFLSKHLESLEAVLQHQWPWPKTPIPREKPKPSSLAATPKPVQPQESAWLDRLSMTELYLPRKLFIIVGVLLLLAGQPLLFLERFFWALLVLGPGTGLLIYALLSHEERIHVGRMDVLYQTLLLALPGLLCLIIGNVLLIQYVHRAFWKETLGLALNTAGIFLLLKLLPNYLPDPEPDVGPVLDQLSGRAANRTQWFIKIGLALLAFVLFYWMLQVAAEGQVQQALLLTLIGLLALFLSFPWAGQKSPSTTPGLLVRWAWKFGRLALFGLALYLGYQGQKLIAQEQLFPGLYRFAVAVLALILAWHEPQPELQDELTEKPLAWYWELGGLLVILSVATWLRAYLLDIMPYGIECDEAGGGVHALDVIEGRFNSLTAHPVGRPLFMLLPKVVGIYFLGYGNIGMRLDALVLGMLGILTLYLMLRHFYGPRIALATSALMALARVHIHFSRFGFTNTLFIVLLILGFYFLVKGLSTRRKWLFVLAGVSFSLSIQTETAARLVPFIGLGLLLYYIILQKHFFRRNWRPLLAFFLGVWLAGASIYIFFIKNSHVLLRRVQEVSIYSSDPNAPRDAIRGFIDSAKISLTQFNWHGDYRTRHNGGLSGEPIFDFWTAILFLLGLGYALYHWRRARYFIALVWFFGFMSASVFALEAPQTHRSFGMFPAAFIFIANFLDRSRRLLREVLGAPGAWAGGLVFLILLWPIGQMNYHKYFDNFPAFDTNCTAAAKFIGEKNPEAEHFIMTAYLWQGHPPFQLYAGKISGRFYFSAAEVVPMVLPTTKDVVYTFLLEYPPLLPSIQWFYPQGEYFEEVHPKYGPQFKAWRVPAAEIQRTRGLSARYWNQLAEAGPPTLQRKDSQLDFTWDAETWPVSRPGSAAWDGTIFIPHGGEYIFYLTSTDESEVRISRQVRLNAAQGQEAEKSVWLAGGLHRLRAQAQHITPDGQMQLAWSGHTTVPYYLPGIYRAAFPKQPVPETHFFTYLKPQGLLGTYYPTENWQGRPLKQDIDPALLFVWMGAPFGFSRPLSIDWRGFLQIQQEGDYFFELTQSGYGEIEIDGQTILSQGPPPPNWQPRPRKGNPVRLAPGQHPIVVRWVWQNSPMFQFWWTPPGKPREIVPAWVLTPVEE